MCMFGYLKTLDIILSLVSSRKLDWTHTFDTHCTVISTRVEIGKTRNCVETRRPQGGVFSHNFEFFQFSRVLI